MHKTSLFFDKKVGRIVGEKINVGVGVVFTPISMKSPQYSQWLLGVLELYSFSWFLVSIKKDILFWHPLGFLGTFYDVRIAKRSSFVLQTSQPPAISLCHHFIPIE